MCIQIKPRDVIDELNEVETKIRNISRLQTNKNPKNLSKFTLGPTDKTISNLASLSASTRQTPLQLDLFTCRSH
jgi:hypothetical protein